MSSTDPKKNTTTASKSATTSPTAATSNNNTVSGSNSGGAAAANKSWRDIILQTPPTPSSPITPQPTNLSASALGAGAFPTIAPTTTNNSSNSGSNNTTHHQTPQNDILEEFVQDLPNHLPAFPKSLSTDSLLNHQRLLLENGDSNNNNMIIVDSNTSTMTAGLATTTTGKRSKKPSPLLSPTIALPPQNMPSKNLSKHNDNENSNNINDDDNEYQEDQLEATTTTTSPASTKQHNHHHHYHDDNTTTCTIDSPSTVITTGSDGMHSGNSAGDGSTEAGGAQFCFSSSNTILCPSDFGCGQSTIETASSWATDDDCFYDACFTQHSKPQSKKAKPWRVVVCGRNTFQRDRDFQQAQQQYQHNSSSNLGPFSGTVNSNGNSIGSRFEVLMKK